MERRNLKDAQKRSIAKLEHARNMLKALLKDRSIAQNVRFHMSVELNAFPMKKSSNKNAKPMCPNRPSKRCVSSI